MTERYKSFGKERMAGILTKITLTWVGKSKFKDEPVYTYKLEFTNENGPRTVSYMKNKMLDLKAGDPVNMMVTVKEDRLKGKLYGYVDHFIKADWLNEIQ